MAFKPFQIQKAAGELVAVNSTDDWRRAREHQQAEWGYSLDEVDHALLGSNLVQQTDEAALFSLSPNDRGRLPTLGEWAKEQGLDLVV